MKHDIKVYSTPTCPYCKMAKAYLGDKGETFTDIDVSTDRQAAEKMVEMTGQMGVPVLDIGGTVIIGFDREAIDAALKK